MGRCSPGAEGHPGERLTLCPLPGTGLASPVGQIPVVGGAQRAWGKRLPLKAGGAMHDEMDQMLLVSRSGDSEDSIPGLNNRNGMFHNLQF